MVSENLQTLQVVVLCLIKHTKKAFAPLNPLRETMNAQASPCDSGLRADFDARASKSARSPESQGLAWAFMVSLRGFKGANAFFVCFIKHNTTTCKVCKFSETMAKAIE